MTHVVIFKRQAFYRQVNKQHTTSAATTTIHKNKEREREKKTSHIKKEMYLQTTVYNQTAVTNSVMSYAFTSN